MEALRAEFQALEQALAELRAAIAVEYPRGVPPSGLGWSMEQYQAQKLLGNWALKLAEEQELAMWAALGKEPPAVGEFRPEYDLWSRDPKSRRVREFPPEDVF